MTQKFPTFLKYLARRSSSNLSLTSSYPTTAFDAYIGMSWGVESQEEKGWNVYSVPIRRGTATGAKYSQTQHRCSQSPKPEQIHPDAFAGPAYCAL